MVTVTKNVQGLLTLLFSIKFSACGSIPVLKALSMVGSLKIYVKKERPPSTRILITDIMVRTDKVSLQYSVLVKYSVVEFMNFKRVFTTYVLVKDLECTVN